MPTLNEVKYLFLTEALNVESGKVNELEYQWLFGLLGEPVPPPPNPPSGGLLPTSACDEEPPWESATEGTITTLPDFWYQYTNNSIDTTQSLVCFFEIGNVAVGNRYKISARFRDKSAIGTDYRLALAEYAVAAWRGATSTQITTQPGSPTEVYFSVERTVTEADTDRMRFAVQLVSPPAAGMSIEVSACLAELVEVNSLEPNTNEQPGEPT